MRYITTSHLREGMELASVLYDSTLRPMMSPGIKLTGQHIQRIKDSGYAGVYIDDDFTRDIVVQDPISEEMRLETVRSARELLQDVQRGGYEKGFRLTKVRQERIIMPVLEALISSNRRFVDRMDIKPYDDYEYYHTSNCVILSMLLGLEMGLSGTRLYDLGFAALLHDVGNLFIPEEILKKPGRLTPEEYDIVKQHSEKGFEYMRKHFDVSIEACLGALHHHENYDGGGYPYQLKRNRISIYGRIIAITDVFDALISHRPYRKPMFHDEAFAYLESMSGTIFDPAIVKAFRHVVALYPTGFTVQINTGAHCVVVDNYSANTTRPKLRLEKNFSQVPLMIDLFSDPNYHRISVTKTVDA